MKPLTLLSLTLVLLIITEGCQKKTVNAILETSKGTIELELFQSDAPKTVANFTGLAEQGYFNGIIFHRVAK